MALVICRPGVAKSTCCRSPLGYRRTLADHIHQAAALLKQIAPPIGGFTLLATTCANAISATSDGKAVRSAHQSRNVLRMPCTVDLPCSISRNKIMGALTVLTPVSEKKSNAGRKPIDVMVMIDWMPVLQSLYNLSDEQVEYQVRDRLSFTRFLRLGIEDSILDGTTLWLFRETLAKAGLIEKLFMLFGQHLEAKGYIARGGQMVDADDRGGPQAAQQPRRE